MDDEDRLHEIDERVRAALALDPATARRIAARALTETATREARRPSVLFAAAAALVIPLGAAVWLAGRPPHSPPPLATLSISSSGSMLVVDGGDGRRWVVGPPAEPRQPGRYVIVISR